MNALDNKHYSIEDASQLASTITSQEFDKRMDWSSPSAMTTLAASHGIIESTRISRISVKTRAILVIAGILIIPTRR